MRLRWIIVAGVIGLAVAWWFANIAAAFVTVFGCLILYGLRVISVQLDAPDDPIDIDDLEELKTCAFRGVHSHWSCARGSGAGHGKSPVGKSDYFRLRLKTCSRGPCIASERRIRRSLGPLRKLLMQDAIDEAIDRSLMRLASPRSHFVGFLCFWSLWMLSVSFWKAALISFFVSCLMVFHLERRFVTVCVLIVALAGMATFLGFSIGDVKKAVNDLRATAV